MTHCSTRMQRLFYPLALALAVPALLCGCGSKTGRVSGKVTYKDKPVQGGTVTFLVSGKHSASSPIGEDGSYSIEKVPVGPAKISIVPPVPAGPGGGGPMMDPSKFGGGVEKPAAQPKTKPLNLPEKYKNPEKSGLEYTVTPGSQEHNIPLK